MRRYLKIISIGIVLIILESSFAQTVPTIINGWFEKSKDRVDGRFSQGVATDGFFWYFSSRGGLYKTDANFNMLIEKHGTQNPIPRFLRDQGYDHIGDIAYFEGKLYAPVEDVSYAKPVIVTYDADGLNFTGHFVQVPQSHFPWIAVDPRTRYFYSSEFNNVKKLFVYDSEQDFALIDEVILNEALFRVQGGVFLGNFLYLACDDGDYVYEVDITTGTVKPILKVLAEPEMEGIEAHVNSGALHFVAETGGSTNIFYHYDCRILAHDVRVSSIITPEPKVPILQKVTPVATIQNLGMNPEQTFNVTCVIDTAGVEIYRDTQIVSNITSLGVLDISFDTWVPKEVTGYNFIFITELSSDLNTGNDTLRFNMEASNTIDDFESGTERWNLAGGWQLTVGRNNTRGIATTPRPYQNNTDSPLTYWQPFDLSSFDVADSVALSLWTRYRIEEGKDFCYVEASTDDGENWLKVGSYTGTQNAWIQRVHSLGNLTGPGNENVQIRFRLVSDSSGTDGGIFIDDVKIYLGKVPTSVKENRTFKEEIPKRFNLFQNYPNPFNLKTVISYEVPDFSDSRSVTLTIYDILGQEIRTLVKEPQPAGRYEVVWNGCRNTGKAVPSGMYFYQMVAGNYIETKKLVLIK